MTIVHENTLSLLRIEAKKSNMYRKHAACIMKGNKIVSIAHNYMPKSILYNKQSIHAEVAVLLKLPEKYKNKKYLLKLVVIRIHNMDNCQLILSYPCISCKNFIQKYQNINYVIYS